MSHYRDGEYDGIGVNPRLGFSETNIDFLDHYPEVSYVVLADADSLDVGALRSLRILRFLQLSGFTRDIDLTPFSSLNHLRVEWTSRMKLPAGDSLEHLYLSRFRPRSEGLIGLPSLPNLRELEINLSPLKSLAGLERYPKLRGLQLSYLRRLKRIGSVNPLPSLLQLDCLACKNVEDLEQLSVSTLKTLRLNDCGRLRSIAFLSNLPNLQEFRFMNTSVIDGDMTPCLRLRSVAFSNKRNFSHRCHAIKAAIGDDSV